MYGQGYPGNIPGGGPGLPRLIFAARARVWNREGHGMSTDTGDGARRSNAVTRQSAR